MSEELKLPEVLPSLRVKVITGCGNMYVHLSFFEGKVCEVFATLGHGGGCASAESEALTRIVTAGLRSGVSVEELIKQLKGIRCPSPMPFPPEKSVMSCPDGIGKTLERFLNYRVNVIVPTTEAEHKAIVEELRSARRSNDNE